MTTASRYRLQVRLQKRLGALDRLLGALTHRGFLPQEFVAETQDETDSVLVSAVFDCDDEHTVEKLSRWLDKQVQVLTVSYKLLGDDQQAPHYATPPQLSQPHASR